MCWTRGGNGFETSGCYQDAKLKYNKNKFNFPDLTLTHRNLKEQGLFHLQLVALFSDVDYSD